MNRNFSFCTVLLMVLLTTTVFSLEMKLIEGSAMLKKTGQFAFTQFNPKLAVTEGDMIKTLDNSIAEIIYPDQTVFRIAPNTQIQLRNNSVHIQKGKTWIKLVKRGSTFIASTPTAVAGVRGTEFVVETEENSGDDFSVLSGSIYVRSGESEVDVAEGQTVSVPQQGQITSAQPIPRQKRSFFEVLANRHNLPPVSPDVNFIPETNEETEEEANNHEILPDVPADNKKEEEKPKKEDLILGFPGDLDGNGKVEKIDAMLFRFLLQDPQSPKVEQPLRKNADVNSDEKVDSEDLSLIELYLSGKGDINKDDIVNLEDVNILKEHIENEGGFKKKMDLNGSRTVDNADLMILKGIVKKLKVWNNVDESELE
jgi:mannose-6-phosphate isomerase-like protein (cupin superfamily)